MADVVSEPESPLNDLPPGQTEASARADGSASTRRRRHRAVQLILLLWAVQFAAFSLDRHLRDPAFDSPGSLLARLLVSGAGVLLSLAILQQLRRSAGKSFFVRAVIAFALALVAAVVHALVNVVMFQAILGASDGASLDDLAILLPPLVFFFSWVHLAIAVVLLSLAYGEELAQRERRIAEADEQLTKLRQLRPSPGDEPHLWVRSGSERVRLNLSSIDWIGAEGEYVRLHSADRSWLERASMGEMAERLSPLGFVRVHRSAIVNADRVESLGRAKWGALELRLRTGHELRVGKSFQPLVRNLFIDAAGAEEPSR